MRRRHRHERWLHARIPEELEDALKREALRRRWPVSTLVRDVLEGALDMVEHIVEDSVEIARRSRGERVAAAPPPRPRPTRALDGVYGWQELILNRDAACALRGGAPHRGRRPSRPHRRAGTAGGPLPGLHPPAARAGQREGARRMTHCGDEHRHRRGDWDRAGNAAEDFARRIVRDAQRFGERVAEHASGFAREVTREWRHGRRV
jgi:hypothetical protein